MHVTILPKGKFQYRGCVNTTAAFEGTAILKLNAIQDL